MLWNFPIEPLEERYSAQWARWWPRELGRLGVAHEMVNGAAQTSRIERGEFLDTVGTHHWKATQLAAFLARIHEVRDGDWVLLHDAWNPMLEALAYVRDTSGPRFKIAGIFHAGTYDPHDYLAQRGLGAWAANVERGWMQALDLAFVATDEHRRLLSGARGGKPIVAGLPFYTDEFVHHALPQHARAPIVVFPHRLAPEKNPDVFRVIQQEYEARYPSHSVSWVRTKDVCKTKDDYYALLGSAKVAVSCADQETWGIAMLESWALGCCPVAPRRLSYPETMPADGLYNTIEEAVDAVHAGLSAPAPAFAGSRWRNAIASMCACMEVL